MRIACLGLLIIFLCVSCREKHDHEEKTIGNLKILGEIDLSQFDRKPKARETKPAEEKIQPAPNPLLRILPYGACIYKNNVCLFNIAAQRITRILQYGKHHFAVIYIHLTAIGLHIELRLVRIQNRPYRTIPVIHHKTIIWQIYAEAESRAKIFASLQYPTPECEKRSCIYEETHAMQTCL